MGKNFRTRVNRKGTTTIGKGQSSSQNAAFTKFRDAAKIERAAHKEPLIAIDDRVEQAATADPVARLGLDEMNFDEGNTEASDGGMTAISRFTNCTNPTFEPVNRIWKSGSTIQKDVISVLATAVDIIKEKEGSQSDVEYFGVLLSTLDALPIEDVKKVLDRKLHALAVVKEAHGAIKFLVAALGTLLKAQPPAFWLVSDNKTTAAELVAFTIHPHPGVRMMSRRILRALLTEEPYVKPHEVHPSAKMVSSAVKEELEIANGNRETITRLLCLLEGILYRMPETNLASLLEILLQLGAASDSTVRCSAFQCIQRTLERPPSPSAFPINRNAELILALRAHQTPADISVFAYWLQALSEAHCCLSKMTPDKSINLLPETLDIFGKAFNTPSSELGHAVHLSLNKLMAECIKTNPQAAKKCLEVLEKSLNVQNTSIWKFVLQSMAVLFDECKNSVEGPLLNKVLLTLAALREKDDCICPGNIDVVFGSAIRNIGLSKIISIVDLNVDLSASQMPTDFPRSWMLPLLSEHVQNERICYYVESIMPFLVALHDRIPKLEPFVAKLYTTLETQYWQILPQLLNSPVDFTEYFPTLAPMIGSALTHRLDLRLVLLRSLRSAIRFAEKNNVADILKRFAKNYFPILFNIYTALPAETIEAVEKQGITNYDDMAVRLSTLETIRAYILHTPDDVKKTFLDLALNKLRDDDVSLEKKQAIADLIIALIKGLNGDQFIQVFTVVEKWFTSNLSSFQKKAYRILSEMYARINEPTLRPFFEKNAPFVKKLISQGLKKVLPPARAPRIGVYRAILTTFNDYEDLKHFVDSILEQVILSQDKSFGKRTRQQAAHCFLQICSGLMAHGSDSDITPSVALEPVLDVVIKIYNNPQESETEVSLEQARAALISSNMITQKYIKLLNPSVLSKLIHFACETLKDSRGAVKLLAVRCVRIMCNKLEEFVMTQFKSLILESIFKQNLQNDTQRVRKANRLLLEVLVERYGPELLLNATDKDDFVKQIKNIEKIRRRRERRQNGTIAEEDEEMDEDAQSTFTTADTVKADTIFDILEDTDDEDEEEKEKRPKKAADNVFLNEYEDEIVDLLDRDAVIQKLSTKEKSSEKRVKIEIPKKDDTFQMAKDGRIVIINIDKKRKRYNSEMFEDNEDARDARKNRDDEADEVVLEQQEDNRTVVASTYKPGGHGIHRSVAHSQAMSYVSNAAQSSSGKKQKRSDEKKKGDKFEPYAYVPLRNKGRKNGLKSILKKNNKGKKSKKSK
uniref:Ribosomal RNA-processing protein 12-like conserved domain-containing protein n=1 Tax=Panagrolaimus superbus TaxID=310955 RepID=A0A914Z5N7_9BILA